jgi:hypothetical protein
MVNVSDHVAKCGQIKRYIFYNLYLQYTIHLCVNGVVYCHVGHAVV